MLNTRKSWGTLPFQRRLETFGPDGTAVEATGPGGDVENVCLSGELTDLGRTTTLALGSRLRALYVDHLGFLPTDLDAPETYYLRATPIVRALESMQQVFTGLYPASVANPPPIVHTRNPADENLFPNEASCRRFRQLGRAFADMAAKRWNNSPEMGYLQSKIGKWMPEGERVAVDGHPRLSGLFDSINSTLAHGPETRLPDEFYDPEVRRIINEINVDEWYRGYADSAEFRRLGVGSLLGDISLRAGAVVSGESKIKFALMGCHDTTIAGVLAALGAFDQEWPPFTSAIAVETFRVRNPRRSFWERVVSNPDKEKGWYVRLRYNDQPVVVAECKGAGRHLEGDESFCTMAAFRETVGKMAPKDWKHECMQNLNQPAVPKVVELVD